MTRLKNSLLFVLIFNLFVVGGSIIGGLVNKGDITRYFSEGETVTFFSALFLGLTSFISCINFLLFRRIERNTPLINFWSLSTAAFFYLTIDEFFMVHEGMDRAILRSLGLAERAYNFDGFILGLFGIIALLIIARYKKTLSAMKNFTYLIGVGFFCFFAMVVADQLEGNSVLFKVIDDSFKMIGVSFFLMAYLNAFLSYIDVCLEGRLPDRA